VLQIISGKFFNSDERHVHEGKGILYSNCSWGAPIKTSIGILEPVDYSGDISGFVFNYKNQIEKGGVLVRCGDDEILEQFKLICSFGLKSYFSEYREQVMKTCSTIKSKNTQGYPASQFLSDRVLLKKNLSGSEVQRFVKLTNKIISLDRKSYKKVINSLRTLSDVVETVTYNIDLAYSMIVYCLESLSQNVSYPRSSWDDWDKNSKSKLEKILAEVPEKTSDDLKRVLLEDKHFKLQQRYISFVKQNLSEGFYINEADGIQIPLRGGQLEKSLSNTYQMRSKFVHSLQPIQDQIRHPVIGKNDVFTFSENPYLTFSGLFRLASHVVENYIFSLASNERENFNYRQDLPGIMTMEMAPQYWIWRDESFNGKTVNQRLGAFLGQLESGQPVTELTKVMAKIKRVFSQTPVNQRAPMLYLFWVYNFILQEDLRTPGWESFVSKHEEYFSEVRFENIAVRVVTDVEVPWSLYECIKEYKKYSKNRHKAGHLSLTPLTEASILCSIANKAKYEGAGREYYWLINTALSELSGKREVQAFLYKKMLNFEEINTRGLIEWNRAKEDETSEIA